MAQSIVRPFIWIGLAANVLNAGCCYLLIDLLNWVCHVEFTCPTS